MSDITLVPCNTCGGEVHYVEQGYDPRWGPAYSHIHCSTCDEDYVIDFCIPKAEMISRWNANGESK